MLNTVDDVIETLGGATAVAALAGVGVPAVSNWSKRGRISQGSFMIVRDALAALGKEAAPSVFGFKEAATNEARPSVLLRVADGYGMIVTGDSMDPVLKTGSTALINPHLPPRVGDLCLFRCHKDDGSSFAAVKEYRGETETHWKARQYNPPKDFTFKKSEWQDRHRVVGTYFS